MGTGSDPIRLKVRYSNDRELLTEYTGSISRGGCVIKTEKPIPVGTEFLFEMSSDQNLAAAEVRGRVVRVSEGQGRYDVVVQYSSDERTRQALEAVLMRVMVDPHRIQVRQHPRIPVNLVCRGEVEREDKYLVRDLSMGGMGLALAAGRPLPDKLELGTGAHIKIKLGQDATIYLQGRVAWLAAMSEKRRATVGVQFQTLTDSQRLVIYGMTHLFRPEELLLSFDFDQVHREQFAMEPPPHPTLHDLPLIVRQSAITAIKKISGLTLTSASVGELPAMLVGSGVCVGFSGALEGEILLAATPKFASQFADRFLDESVGDAEVVSDAMREFLSTVLGQTGDSLEEHGYAIDVLPSTETSFTATPKTGEQRFIYHLEGAGDPVVLAVLTRPARVSY